LPELIAALAHHAGVALMGGETSLVTRERHRVALRKVVEALDRALEEGPAGREDIVAEELRLAARELGRLTGRVDVEDVLDVIFRDFCIGK
jgi:tRNA modification GTPase